MVDSALTPLDTLPSQPSGTVLVVEDNPVNRVIAEEMLQSLGLDCIPGARRRRGARTCWRGARVDLVLMDCQMPVMDGYTATQHPRPRAEAAPAAHADRGADRQRLTKKMPRIALEAAWMPTSPNPRATARDHLHRL